MSPVRDAEREDASLPVTTGAPSAARVFASCHEVGDVGGTEQPGPVGRRPAERTPAIRAASCSGPEARHGSGTSSASPR